MSQKFVDSIHSQRSSMVSEAALVFLQMLPATMLTPAIRPLFQQFHSGNEHAMHAFMAINMLGAVLAVPIIGAWAQRSSRPQRIIAYLLAADALLLGIMASPLSLYTLLTLRFLEGACHVSATALLLAQIASHAKSRGKAHAMGVAGAALMFAVALGSGVGGQLVAYGPRFPFFGAALIQLMTLTLLIASRLPDLPLVARTRLRPIAFLREHPALRVPIAATFVGRFTVGCIIVTFALFVHRYHGGSDRAVGMMFMLLTLSFALSMYPLSRLSDRVPRATLMGLGGAVYAVSLAAIAIVPFGTLPAVMVIAGVSSSALFAPALCYGAVLGGERKEMAMSLINVAGCLGMLFGPAAAGIMSAALGKQDPIIGYRAAFMLGAGSVALWLALSLPWLVRQLRAEAQETAVTNHASSHL